MLKEAGAEIRLVCQIQARKQALKMRQLLDEVEAAAYARWVHLKSGLGQRAVAAQAGNC
jgi:hypothetical protein